MGVAASVSQVPIHNTAIINKPLNSSLNAADIVFKSDTNRLMKNESDYLTSLVNSQRSLTIGAAPGCPMPLAIKATTRSSWS